MKPLNAGPPREIMKVVPDWFGPETSYFTESLF
jgi:hypothetical protein